MGSIFCFINIELILVVGFLVFKIFGCRKFLGMESNRILNDFIIVFLSFLWFFGLFFVNVRFYYKGVFW